MLLLGLISLMASCFLGGYLFFVGEMCHWFSDGDVPERFMPLLATCILIYLTSLWLIVSSVTG